MTAPTRARRPRALTGAFRAAGTRHRHGGSGGPAWTQGMPPLAPAGAP